MAWIEVVPPEASSDELKVVERDIAAGGMRGGAGAGIIRVFSLIPHLMRARVEFAQAMTFGGSGLGRRTEELISTQVSALVGCVY